MAEQDFLSKLLESLPENIDLTVVTIKGQYRCIYLNEHRIHGSKPYVSEGGDYSSRSINRLELFNALFPRATNMMIAAKKQKEKNG